MRSSVRPESYSSRLDERNSSESVMERYKEYEKKRREMTEDFYKIEMKKNLEDKSEISKILDEIDGDGSVNEYIEKYSKQMEKIKKFMKYYNDDISKIDEVLKSIENNIKKIDEINKSISDDIYNKIKDTNIIKNKNIFIKDIIDKQQLLDIQRDVKAYISDKERDMNVLKNKHLTVVQNLTKLLDSDKLSPIKKMFDGTCPICYDKKIDSCISPCGHMFCGDCLRRVYNCPMCRGYIDKKVKLNYTAVPSEQQENSEESIMGIDESMTYLAGSATIDLDTPLV